MKILFLSAVLLFMFSCKTDTSTIEPLPAQTPIEIIRVDEEINTYMLNPSKYTWKDLDNYYRRMIDTDIDANLKDNLKNLALYSLCEDFHLLTEASSDDLLYYHEQYLTLDYNMKIENHAKLLEVLHAQNKISDQSLQKEAAKALAIYQKKIDTVDPNEKDEILSKQNAGMELLNRLAIKS